MNENYFFEISNIKETDHSLINSKLNLKNSALMYCNLCNITCKTCTRRSRVARFWCKRISVFLKLICHDENCSSKLLSSTWLQTTAARSAAARLAVSHSSMTGEAPWRSPLHCPAGTPSCSGPDVCCALSHAHRSRRQHLRPEKK